MYPKYSQFLFKNYSFNVVLDFLSNFPPPNMEFTAWTSGSALWSKHKFSRLFFERKFCAPRAFKPYGLSKSIIWLPLFFLGVTTST
jgi:hypothetical protein